MISWPSFAKKFGRRREEKEAQLEITLAYRHVFLGNPSRQEQQMVLADLAAKCGWNTITVPSGVASEELWFREGMRKAFSEVWKHLSLSHDDIAAIENAIRHEVAMNATNAT